MNKKFIAIVFIVAVIAGAAGFLVSEYFSSKESSKQITGNDLDKEYQEAIKEAQKQQKELENMARQGKVKDVKTNELTIEVTKSSHKGEIGKSIIVKINPHTNVQKGMAILEHPVDLTEHLKPGVMVDVLVKNDNALALYWDPLD